MLNHRPLIDGVAKLGRRLILQVMRLVDDQVLVLRQDTAAGHYVGQEQRVIDDHQVSVLGRTARPIEEALVALLEQAARRDAGVLLLGHLPPERLLIRS